MSLSGYRESCKTLFFSEKLQTFTADKEFGRKSVDDDFSPRVSNELGCYDSKSKSEYQSFQNKIYEKNCIQNLLSQCKLAESQTTSIQIQST